MLIVIDTETTGLNYLYDEILQFSAVDEDGNVLLDTYIKPVAAEWAEAEAIHGISPEMVQNKPSIGEILEQIQAIVDKATIIVSYNGWGFDMPFLQTAGIHFHEDLKYFDVMEEFAPIYGEWDDYHKNYRWQKLTTCAKYYGYQYTDKAHNSLEDAKATLHCYKRMTEVIANENRPCD